MIALVGALIAASVAAGLLLVASGVRGRAVSLETALAELHRPRAPGRGSTPARRDLWIDVAGPLTARRAADLEVCGRDRARWASDRCKWAALLATLAAVGMTVVPAAGGGRSSASWVVGALVVGGVAGWFYAVVDLRQDADKARREVRHAVAAYLELVTILMAGGAGTESAMSMAAEIGRGPGIGPLRSALAAAQARQEPPWSQFGRVGDRLGVRELSELGASMRLAGGGAQVKDTLAAKAASIRISDLAQVEAEAHARSETMALPVVLMFAGFLLLIGYPALAGLTGP